MKIMKIKLNTLSDANSLVKTIDKYDYDKCFLFCEFDKEKKEFNQLKIRKAVCDGKALEIAAERCTILSKREIQMLSVKETHKIEIELV